MGFNPRFEEGGGTLPEGEEFSKARENTLSCGIPETLSQPHNRRRLGLDEMESMRPRVVGIFQTGLAMKARTNATRLCGGRPVPHLDGVTRARIARL